LAQGDVVCIYVVQHVAKNTALKGAGEKCDGSRKGPSDLDGYLSVSEIG
jgi:hypothetical protein